MLIELPGIVPVPVHYSGQAEYTYRRIRNQGSTSDSHKRNCDHPALPTLIALTLRVHLCLTRRRIINRKTPLKNYFLQLRSPLGHPFT